MDIAVLCAAGSGTRLGAAVPKAFVPLAGRPMIDWSIIALREAGITEIVVPAPDSVAGPDTDLQRLCRWVGGGATRSLSVRQGVRAALAVAVERGVTIDRVLVHDAARPLVPAALFGRCLRALDAAEAAIAAAPVVDTIKQADAHGTVERTLDRSRLWAVQTPQAFRAGALVAALEQDDAVLAAATDDASLVEAQGGRVVLVEGPSGNFKVTTPHDLQVAELLLGGLPGPAAHGRPARSQRPPLTSGR